jgi:ribosomal protein S18 acetylase RimI-like enzyme
MERCFGQESLLMKLVDPNIEFWLAEDGASQIVGFLKLVLKKQVQDYPLENALYLEKIYLMPDFFGQGAGQHLIAFCEATCNSQLVREAVWLMVMKNWTGVGV